MDDGNAIMRFGLVGLLMQGAPEQNFLVKGSERFIQRTHRLEG